MNPKKPLAILVCLLAVALVPSVCAQQYGYGWENGPTYPPTPTPTAFITPTPTPLASTNPTSDVTANPTATETPQPTQAVIPIQSTNPTPTPTVQELNILVIVILMIICAVGIMLTVYGLKGGADQ